MSNQVKLKVMEALQEEAYKGIIRIDSDTMKSIGVRPGDIIEIEGGRTTVGIIDRAYPSDVGQSIIRMDGILRKNAKTGIGENVIVRKAEVKEAKSLVIAPAQKGVMIQAHPDIFKRGLLGRAVIKGDIIVLGGTRSRRRALSDSSFFEDPFSSIMEDTIFGGIGFPNFNIKFIIAEVNPKQAVIITENTNIKVNPTAIDVKDGGETSVLDITYEDIGGLDQEIVKIREMVELPLRHPEIFSRLSISPPAGVLLYGPPGTGKTLLAKAVANESEANFILVNGPEIMNKFYGESEKRIREIFEEAEKSAPSIIFIDEIDAIAPKREDTHGELERRVVAQLLSMMDGLKTRSNVVVIGATNRPNAIDPALRRPGRFDREIQFGIPDKKGRLKILKIHTRNMPLTKDVDLDYLSSISHGFVGADLSALAKEAAMNVLRRLLPEMKLREKEPIPKDLLEKLIITQQDFKEALKIVRPSAMREILVETPNIKWEDIGGLEGIKQELKEAVEWPLKYPTSFTNMGIRPPRGILLYGPPGTGKTLLAKAVANESESNFIYVNGPSLLNKWVGESEKGIREIFEKARQVSPSIIFFDEIDAIAPRRGMDMGSKVTERMVNTLLSEMDGLESLADVVVIAATNRPDMIDPALLRPGRFDRIIMAPIPDKKSRLEIFKIHTKNMPIEITKENIREIENHFKFEKDAIISRMAADEVIKQSDTDKLKDKKINFKELLDKDKFLYYLAEKTDNFAGADIEALCREAAMLVLRKDINAKEVPMKAFEEALAKTRPSITLEDINKYKEIEEQYIKTARGAAIREIPNYFG